MAVDLNVHGANRLAAVAKRLKETGDKDLRKELYRGIQRAGKPLREATKASAREHLPRKGGLNELIARSRYSMKTRSGENPTVQFVAARKGIDMKAIERGRLRHPVFGNRKNWVTQTIAGGFFARATQDAIPEVRKEVVKVLDDIAEKIARG